LLVFRFQCFDATVYTANKVVQRVYCVSYVVVFKAPAMSCHEPTF